MPKSFLVKKKLRTKSSSDEDENVCSGKDGQNVKFKETHFLRQPCTKEVKAEPAMNDAWRTCTIDDQSVPTKIETEKSLPEAKLAGNHGNSKLQLQNIMLSRFNSESLHNQANTASKEQCKRCKRTYATNSALVKHQRYYCNFFQTKSFTCKYCDKVYLSLGALKMHIRTHTLPCRCMICGKAFSRPWLLQGHIRTHTGEKPYECSNCSRAFADRSNLRAHLQTHSDVKKYKCEHCSKTFSRMSLLLKHQNTGCPMINV